MNARLLVTKLLLVAALPLMIFSHHVHQEGHVVDSVFEAVGLTLLLVASGGRFWASLFITGKKNAELVTRGPYAMVRNPLYLFSFAGFLGAGLAFESLVLTALLALVFVVGHVPAIRQEEARLARLFGADYEAYAREVPAFVPKRLPALSDIVPAKPAVCTRSLADAALIPWVAAAANALEWAKLAEIIPVVIVLP